MLLSFGKYLPFIFHFVTCTMHSAHAKQFENRREWWKRSAKETLREGNKNKSQFMQCAIPIHIIPWNMQNKVRVNRTPDDGSDDDEEREEEEAEWKKKWMLMNIKYKWKLRKIAVEKMKIFHYLCHKILPLSLSFTHLYTVIHTSIDFSCQKSCSWRSCCVCSVHNGTIHAHFVSILYTG